MPERKGSTIFFGNRPTIRAGAAAVGKLEGEGPLGDTFDAVFQDDSLGADSWEKAESLLQKTALDRAVEKAGIRLTQLQCLLAGDLLNQCTASTFGLRDTAVPLLGQYGACSTMAQTLGVAAILVDSGAADLCAAVTSSHFCAAERQFRFPLEYGGQRTPTSQWTATAAGAAIVGLGGGNVHIAAMCPGRIVDYGITDVNNMGAAMAPAAADTIARFLDDTATIPEDYDLIVTGDLSAVGSELMIDLLGKKGIALRNHADCGLLMYDRLSQDVHAGGSGCGCSAAVLCGHLLQKMHKKEYRNLLFIGTGALLSPTTSQQGESIPGIAHLVQLISE